MQMFFDPVDYLERSPAAAETAAARLAREAKQRAALCKSMTRMAAEAGFGETKIYLTAKRCGLGLSTYYKLYETREACLLEAFEKCSEAVLGLVQDAAAGPEGEPEQARAALGALLDALAAEPDVARLLLVEVRAAGPACREAQLLWLARIEQLVESRLPRPSRWETTRLAVGGLATVLALEAAAGRAGQLAEIRDELADAAVITCRDR